MTYQEILATAEEKLKKAGVEEFKSDAWILFSRIFKMERVDFMMACLDTLVEGSEATDSALLEYNNAIDERISGTPVQYITHTQNFYGLDFYVDNRVLIPRMDTEVLVEQVMLGINQALLEGKVLGEMKVLDMCTGSGCIAITLANMLELGVVFGSDISKDALKVASMNNETYDNRVKLIESDLFEGIEERGFDIIVSNPPYIESSVIDTLDTQVKDSEPRLALDGSEDGLKFYRAIVSQAGEYLKEDGLLFFEIGYNQAQALRDIFEENGYKDVRIIKDLAGLDRVAVGRVG